MTQWGRLRATEQKVKRIKASANLVTGNVLEEDLYILEFSWFICNVRVNRTG